MTPAQMHTALAAAIAAKNMADMATHANALYAALDGGASLAAAKLQMTGVRGLDARLQSINRMLS